MSMEISLDYSSRKKINPIWTFGGNTCHAPLLLRKDLLNHLKMVKKQLGFKYIRCHGALSDDMGTVRSDGSYDFTNIYKMIDNLLEIGLRPFFGFCAMPGLYATSEAGMSHYVFRSAPPKDWNCWYRLIKSLMLGLKERYGIKELLKWYFEVWNEPDIDYWTGTQAEYFKLYDLSAKAVKEVDIRLRIGGPATSKTLWIDEFIAHVKNESPDFGLNGVSRCDFISTHAYPSDLAFSDSASGNVELHNSGIMKKLFGAARIKIDEAFGVDFPLICGEWNSSAGPYKSCHDECNNAPFIAKIMDDLSGICQGSLFWNISDIYEEVGFHYQPFHGGYGIISVNDIPKSSFNAFKYLNSLGDQRLAVTFSQETVGLGCIATTKGNKTIVIVYYYREPNMEQPESETIQLRGLPDSASEARVSTILPGRGSAYETCLEIGKPEFANRKILGVLEKASRPETTKVDLSAGTLKIGLGTLMKIEF